MAVRKIKGPTYYFSNNEVCLVRGGAEYFNVLQQLIDSAEIAIHFQTYIFSPDETGERVSAALLRAAQRGVKIFLLLDGYASQGLPTEWINTWLKAGIYFRFFQPLFRSKSFYFGRRLHHKVVVADAVRALVGGVNISNRYNDLPGQPAWLDWALHVEGEVALVLEDICKKRMKHQRYRISYERALSYKIKINTVAVRVRVNDWVTRKRQITRSYLEMLRNAQSHVYIMSPYFIPGAEIRKKMRAAAARGVKINLILAGISDVPLAKPAERFMYAWLLRHKIQIYEYQPNVLHGKLASYDGAWFTVGSYNVNNLSAYASIELNLDVRSTRVAHEGEKQLQSIIKNECIHITPDRFNASTNVLDKFQWWLSYQLMRASLYLTTFYFRQKE